MAASSGGGCRQADTPYLFNIAGNIIWVIKVLRLSCLLYFRRNSDKNRLGLYPSQCHRNSPLFLYNFFGDADCLFCIRSRGFPEWQQSFFRRIATSVYAVHKNDIFIIQTRSNLQFTTGCNQPCNTIDIQKIHFARQQGGNRPFSAIPDR